MRFEMPGFHQLVEELGKRYPEDWWIESRRESARLLPENAFPQVAVYDRALRGLDEDSRAILTEKARKAFSEPRSDRGKHQFFNLLNEALAYEYLVSVGFNNVRLLKANSRNKSPDISYGTESNIRYCEVKTVGVSDQELARNKSGGAFSSSVYTCLNQNFFTKLCSTIHAAVRQIEAVQGVGSIYLIVHFDDFVLDYYETYKSQISEFLVSAFSEQEVIVRTGIDNARYILHSSHKPVDGCS
jgi:hypothetical protein